MNVDSPATAPSTGNDTPAATSSENGSRRASRGIRERLREAVPVAAVLAGGLATGIGVKFVDAAATPSWLRDLGNYPALFVLALVLLSVTAPGLLRAAIRAVCFFVALCAGYYASSLLGFGFLSRPSLIAWTLAAVTVVPLGAVLLRWAFGRSGLLAGVVFAAAGGAVLADGTIRQMYWAWTGDITREEWFVLHPVQAALDVVLAVVFALVLPRTWRTRLCAVVLLVPMTVLAGRAVDLAYAFGGLG